jgi:hypothetical protein
VPDAASAADISHTKPVTAVSQRSLKLSILMSLANARKLQSAEKSNLSRGAEGDELVEHCVHIAGVAGSSPVPPTINPNWGLVSRRKHAAFQVGVPELAHARLCCLSPTIAGSRLTHRPYKHLRSRGSIATEPPDGQSALMQRHSKLLVIAGLDPAIHSNGVHRAETKRHGCPASSLRPAGEAGPGYPGMTKCEGGGCAPAWRGVNYSPTR